MVAPKISVQIISRAADTFRKLTFKSAIECLLYAKFPYEVIIIDNGMRKDICDMVREMLENATREGVLPGGYKIIQAYHCNDFAELRNKALDAMSPLANRLFHQDDDECVPSATLQEILNICEVHDPICIGWNFFHFVLSISQYQDVYPKINFIKVVPGLRWRGATHEWLDGFDKAQSYNTALYFLHLASYTYPQFLTALKWLKYDVYEKGHVNGYREYRDDDNSPTKDYYSDERDPSKCLEDRKLILKDFDCGKYTYTEPFINNVLVPWVESGLEWEEFVSHLLGPGGEVLPDGVKSIGMDFWEKWKAKRQELGSWKSTLNWACSEMACPEIIK